MSAWCDWFFSSVEGMKERLMFINLTLPGGLIISPLANRDTVVNGPTYHRQATGQLIATK